MTSQLKSLAAMSTDLPRLYLITPPISDWAAYPPVFEAAATACDVACVLLRIVAPDEGERQKIVRALAPSIQKHGIACLIADDPQLVAGAGADGVHIEGTHEELVAALKSLQPAYIVGAGGLTTRDAAMSAGEAGADYVMFGGPASAEAQASIVERVAWWTEVFNVPCVGYARDLESIPDLVHAGADFISLSDAVFADPRGAIAALHDVARLMAPTPESAP
jgi:thiamine-phosphate pyrophosphorylase